MLKLLPHALDRSDEDRQEIRVAVVMTGGVSLAVWMGGAAAELYRATHFDELYGEVLDLTASSARVDVIAGTSAGGLNGALLAAGIAGGASPTEFFRIRDLWLSKASMLQMMRHPSKRDPPSLLQGDEYFLPELESAFERLLPRAPAGNGDAPSPIHLIITGTLLRGRLRGFADDFGEVISEVDHRGRFTLRRGEQWEDDFSRPYLAETLALVARSSASFPVAFEASFCPSLPLAEGRRLGRPNLYPIANFGRDRFVIDGGVLLNKPIAPALEAIFTQPSNRHVRRVLAYVVPDPGEAVEPVADKPEELPVLTELAWDSLVRLPRVQLVADELEDLRERNARVQHQIRLREELLARAPADDHFVALATSFFYLYRSKAAEESVAKMLSRAAESVGSRIDDPALEGAREWDRPALRHALVAAREGWFPKSFPDRFPPGSTQEGRPWEWGIASLDSAAAAAIDIFRRAAYLIPLAAEGDPRLRDLEADPDALRADLREQRLRLQDVLERLQLIRRIGEAYWDWRRRMLDPARVGDWAEESYREWLQHPGAGEEEALEPLTRMQKALDSLHALEPWWPGKIEDLEQTQVLESLKGWGLELAGVLVGAAPLFRQIATLSRRVETRRYGGQVWQEESASEDVSPQHVLLRMVKSLVLSDGGDSVEVRNECLRRLLALHVAEMLLGETSLLEQPVAFIRISGEAQNDFDPSRTTASEKLAGIQLGHFGSFFKRSWRANDWMWGRLDGAARLALVLVNPARLRQLGYTDDDAYEHLRRIAFGRRPDGQRVLGRDGKPLLDDSDEAYLAELWIRDQQRIRDELTFLGRPRDPVLPDPESLSSCARAVARAIQIGILREELPSVAEAIWASREEGAAETSSARDFRRAFEQAIDNPAKRLSARAAADLLGKCEVGKERISGELGHDAFTATLAGTAATTVAAAGGAKSGLGPLRAFAASIRVATLAVYVLVQSALRGSRTGFALTTVVLALAGSILALRVLGVEGVPRGVTAIAVAVLVVWALWAAVRTRGWGLFVVGLAAILVVVALYGENVVDALVRNDRVGAVQWADEHPGTLAGLVSLAALLAVWTRFREVKPTWYRRLARCIAVAAVVPLAIGITAPIDDFLDWLQSDERSLDGWRESSLDAAGWLEDHQALVVLCTLVLGAVALNILSRGVRAWARSI